jgi:hypothetical protein
MTYTTCDECGEELYANTGGDWRGSETDSEYCWDEATDSPTTTKHIPDLCADGTPGHNWIGPEFGEQICPECGATQVVVKAQTAAQIGLAGPANNPYAPSNPAIMERFQELQMKRIKEQEERKQRTYRESLGDDFFPDIRFEGGKDPDPGQCQLCPINFGDDKDLLDYHVQQVHGVGVPAPRTCVLTGASGEDPDDCTTHNHEEDEDDDATV